MTPSRLRLLVLLCAVFILASPWPALGATLVGHWPFEEGSGRTLLDASGRGQHGTLSPERASFPRWVPGGIGLALDFDGGDDYFIVPHSSALQLTQFTVGLWIKVDRPATLGTDLVRYRYATILRKGNVAGYINYALALDRTTGFIRATSSFGGTTGEKAITAATSLLDQKWHHVAYTYDGTTQSLYLDGVLSASAVIGLPVRALAGILDVNLCCGFGLDAHYDDLRIYQGALTPAEIMALAFSPRPDFAPLAYPAPQIHPVPPLSTRFSVGGRVKTRDLAHVKTTATTSSAKVGASQAQGVLGTVLAGPVRDSGGGPYSRVQWWQVNFDTGADGWVPDEFLLRDTDPTPPPRSSGTPPLPGFALWEQYLLDYGQYFCRQAFITSQGIWDGSAWFYDGPRMFYQLADYTGLQLFAACAEQMGEMYQTYVFDRNGADYPYRTFTGGFRMAYERTANARAKDAIFYLATNAYGAGEDNTQSGAVRMRENAYLLEHFLDLEAVGWPARPAKVAQAVDNALAMIDQVFVQKTYKMKSFMVGLMAESLIQYHAKTGDPRILPALKIVADGLWTTTWVPASGKFLYCSATPTAGDADCSSTPTPYAGLNLLIAHLYGWLYAQTGQVTYRDQGDAIFVGGVNGVVRGEPWFSSGKQFTQNYRLSFDYLRYRNQQVVPTP